MMELLALKSEIQDYFKGTVEEWKQLEDLLEEDSGVYPFNNFEYLFQLCTSQEKITFEEYLNIRTNYIQQNPNLWIFEIASPTKFGINFAQTYIKGMAPFLEKPSKKIDPTYNNEYDFWYQGLRIEVKASRVVHKTLETPLYMKALASNTQEPFLMNFQQLKPACCDLFIWVAVFRDTIKTWVIPSSVVRDHALYAKGQHRNNHGNEGQLHIKENNIHLFDAYLCDASNILEKIEKHLI